MLPIDKIFSGLEGKQLVPMSLLIVILYVAVCYTKLEDRVMANSENLSEVKRAQVEYNRTIMRMDKRLSHLEDHLHVKNRRDERD